jgi:XTP/dITP diphosphohydrolase
MEIVLATTNQHKVEEIRAILADMPVEITSLRDYPEIPEIEEIGSTFAENASIKARTVSDATGKVALADDSGLEVDALGGLPGVLSNRYAGPGATDEQKYMLVVSRVRDLAQEQRTARFRCAVAIAVPEGDIFVVEGAVEGVITLEPRGDHGFGYDPIFYVPSLEHTMAELPPETKNEISHRGKALQAAKKVLAELVALSG